MKILLFGGGGLVGSRFIELNKTNFDIFSPSAEETDILNYGQLEGSFETFKPDAVVNFAAYTNVEEAEIQNDDKEGICYKINAIGAKNVADVCKKNEVHLVHISTEYVFDGTKSESPYTEDDLPNPINWYGKTKYFGDRFVLESGCSLTIARISMPYSPKYDLKKDVARFFLGQLKAGSTIKAITDQSITPTLVDDIAISIREFIEQTKQGIYNVSSKDTTTPFQFANVLAKAFNLDTSLIDKISLEQYNKKKKAHLLKYSWLDPSKFIEEYGEKKLHTVEESIQIFKTTVDALGGY